MPRPTVQEVQDVLFALAGARPIPGAAWRELPGGRWAIPARAYMGSALAPNSTAHAMPDVVIAPKAGGGGWKLDREVKPQPADPEQIFHNVAALEPS